MTVRAVPAAAVPCLLMALNPGHALGSILFEECFSGPLSRNWTLFGEPLPMICDSMGLPPPSFDNNGDTMYNSGAISRESFDYTGGLVLECDMYLTSNERGAWIHGTLGWSYTPEGRGVDGATSFDIFLSYSYKGEADWWQPHLQGTLDARVRYPDGTQERHRRFRVNEYLDSWHNYRIVIEEDLRVAFLVDSSLFFRTEAALPPDLGDMVIVLGDRSNAWGRVFHDNIVVRTP